MSSDISRGSGPNPTVINIQVTIQFEKTYQRIKEHNLLVASFPSVPQCFFSNVRFPEGTDNHLSLLKVLFFISILSKIIGLHDSLA